MYEVRKNIEKISRQINSNREMKLNKKIRNIKTIQLAKDNNYSCIVYQNHNVYSCSQPSTADGVKSVLDRIPKNELTLVISGTHGNEIGETAASDPSLIEDDFFYEDQTTIENTGRAKTTTLVSAKYLSNQIINDIIETGNFGGIHYSNIILAYCHGRRSIFPAV